MAVFSLSFFLFSVFDIYAIMMLMMMTMIKYEWRTVSYAFQKLLPFCPHSLAVCIHWIRVEFIVAHDVTCAQFCTARFRWCVIHLCVLYVAFLLSMDKSTCVEFRLLFITLSFKRCAIELMIMRCHVISDLIRIYYIIFWIIFELWNGRNGGNRPKVNE